MLNMFFWMCISLYINVYALSVCVSIACICVNLRTWLFFLNSMHSWALAIGIFTDPCTTAYVYVCVSVRVNCSVSAELLAAGRMEQ